jgi:hypothetical protein
VQLRWLRRSIDRGELGGEGFASIAWLRRAADVDGLRIERVAAGPAGAEAVPAG